jgi:hypothetical protein
VVSTCRLERESNRCLGLAVTLEFVGPLALALAGTRRRLDLACAISAGVGVYILVLPDGTTDVIGVGLALLAAVCWACYILLNRLVGRRLPGLQGTATAAGPSALLYLPIVVTLAFTGRLTAGPLLYAMAAGVLGSAIPFAFDLTALRSVPARFVGIFMSVDLVLAALAGVAILHQVPTLHEAVGPSPSTSFRCSEAAGRHVPWQIIRRPTHLFRAGRVPWRRARPQLEWRHRSCGRRCAHAARRCAGRSRASASSPPHSC